MQKKVSVIIPFYNGVNWLCQAVQSILDQTYNNIEIIVVNDGSKEDITPFLDQYGDKIIYLQQENQGPAVARNYGMSNATGDYIAFEDADDIWLPSKLEKQIGYMEKNGLVWSHTGYYNWWPESEKLRQVDNRLDYDDVSEQLTISCRIATPSVVVNKITLEEHPEINFMSRLRKGEDTAYYQGLAQYYKLALVEEPLVKVRMRGSNSFTEVLRRFEKRANYYKENKNNMAPQMQFVGKIYVFYHALFGTKRGRFKEFLAQCFRVFPYFIERRYIKHIAKRNRKDEKYILRWTA